MSFEEPKESYDNLGPSKQCPLSRSTLPSASIDTLKKKMKKSQGLQLKKKKSRISLAVEKTCDNDEDTKSSSKSSSSFGSQDENFESTSLASINVTCVIGQTYKTCNFILNSSVKLKSVIQKSINEMNKLFTNEKALFRLIDDSDSYVFKPAKKSGKPKTDMPPFCEDTTIADTHTTNFCLCWKDDPDDFVVMYERAKGKKLCNNKCIIF